MKSTGFPRILACIGLLVATVSTSFAQSPDQNPPDHIGTFNFVIEIDGINAGAFKSVDGLDLSTGVVEVEDGAAIVKEAPDPGTAKTGPINFWLPELEDEVLVAFYNWQRRIMTTGVAEPHHADLVAYDPAGNVVSRWHLSNAWPRKITLPTYDRDSTLPRRYRVTLQVDDITRGSTRRLAPWPDVRSTRIDPATRTFTMSWRSAPGATYNVYRWDARQNQPVLVERNLVATRDTAFISRLMDEEGIYWVVLSSPPPALNPERR